MWFQKYPVFLFMTISIRKSARNLVWGILILLLLPTSFILYTQQLFLVEWNILNILSSPILITITFDPIGILFSCTVLFISANVLRFSKIYMLDDKFINRFTVLVLLFILSINLLIFIPHFIILLLGWDGLGIVSFILVIYYQNPKSLAAGIITALTNRIGDVILLLSIAWTLNQGHWLIINIWNTNFSTFQIISIIIAAITKSAQIPFSRWLPAAIAAPTPVSALVHSSTLVTAGVFLLIRFYTFLHTLPIFNTLLLLIAVTTIVIAGLRAITECDIKKIIALSTLSQLGIIITRLGLNIPNIAFFHIITHALFKALLFICAGRFINVHLHAQDLRWIGNLTNQIPVASTCISLANIALCGFPFMAGFYSKDIIIESAINIQNNLPLTLLSIIRVGFTSLYSIRLRIVTVWGPTTGPAIVAIKENTEIIIPIVLLSICAIIMGSIITWLPPVRSSIFILPQYIKLLPIFIVILGLSASAFFTIPNRISSCILIKIPYTHYASCMIWYLVPLSSQFIIKLPLSAAHHYLKSIDQGWIEITGSQGINKNINTLSNKYNLIVPKTPSIHLISSSISTLLTVIISIFLFIYLSSL